MSRQGPRLLDLFYRVLDLFLMLLFKLFLLLLQPILSTLSVNRLATKWSIVSHHHYPELLQLLRIQGHFTPVRSLKKLRVLVDKVQLSQEIWR